MDQLSRAGRRLSRRDSPPSRRPTRCRSSEHRACAFIGWNMSEQENSGERHMPLEIKILDYGDIELESSFLVLGRDCGRTRRVLTLGFLISRRPLSGRGRHRLSLQPDHGNAGHARAAVPREHDREPARAPRRAHGRRPLRLPHPSAHRPCRQGRSVSDEHDRRPQPQGAGIFRLRPDASAISGARHQASDRPPAHQERAALPRSRNHRPDRTDARRLLRSRRRPHRRLDEHPSFIPPTASRRSAAT